MPESLIEAQDITKYFPIRKGVLFSRVTGLIKAVDGVDLSIGSSETLGLVGESGCGKTTISRLILLLEDLTRGSIIFQGKNLKEFTSKDLAQYRNCVQAVFQNPFSSLDPRMYIGNIISEPFSTGKTIGKGEIKDRVASLLEAVGLDPRNVRKYPHEFSGGQRQRIAIARALSSNPKLIILDEPVSSQDVSIRAQLLNLLKDLQSEMSLSYLLIGHDLATVRYMSHKVSVMYLGKIVEHALSDELYTNPLHPYTRALFAASLPDKPGVKSVKNVLSGEIPSPLKPPTGCYFHPRCPSAKQICSQTSPTFKKISPTHSVYCLLYE
jgi:oligopeptide transport system ATP-binding protein